MSLHPLLLALLWFSVLVPCVLLSAHFIFFCLQHRAVLGTVVSVYGTCFQVIVLLKSFGLLCTLSVELM